MFSVLLLEKQISQVAKFSTSFPKKDNVFMSKHFLCKVPNVIYFSLIFSTRITLLFFSSQGKKNLSNSYAKLQSFLIHVYFSNFNVFSFSASKADKSSYEVFNLLSQAISFFHVETFLVQSSKFLFLFVKFFNLNYFFSSKEGRDSI